MRSKFSAIGQGLACGLSLFTGVAQAALTTVPQSQLNPTQALYTQDFGTVAVMTGGGNGSNVGNPSGRNDDGFRGPINLNFANPLSFFGGSYTSFWANNNGNISFTGGNSAYVPAGPIGATVPTISIWFGDVDTRNGSSGVMYVQQNVAEQTVVTWDQVGRYNTRGDLLNTFQMVVRGDGYNIPQGEGSIGFFWLGMPWEVTDTSTTAAVGFGNGVGDGVVLEGSNQAGLNGVVAFHKIWFDPNLRPICGVPGTPPCETPEPEMPLLLGVAAIAALMVRRRVRLG